MKLNIVTDQDPENPRLGFTFGTIYYSSYRYILGDQQVSKDRIEEIIKDEDMVYLPVYAYIHSGVALNTTGFSCPWDSGMSGIIAVSKDDIRKEFNVKRITKSVMDKVNNLLKCEVDTFSKYLNGEVYGFEVVDESGNIVDSCYGFYSEEDAISQGNDSLKFHQNKAA